MNPDETVRRLSAILFSDIVGYTARMAESEELGLRLRERHRTILSRLAPRYRGEIVDENGDELVLAFPSATDAVNCALAAQGELREDAELRLRIGIHLGDVVFEGGRAYGDGVNLASRIRPLAEPGGVCISEPVYDSVKNQANVAATSLGKQQLKNVARPIEVFAATGEAGPAAAVPSAERGAADRPRRRLRTVLATSVAVVAALALGMWAIWPLPLGWIVDLAGVGALPVNPPLPGKPSIVVLPFVNMSGDPEQEYFSDGFTEDLTTDLSRAGDVFVIARNSAFTYKGRAVDVQEVGRELGVRYVLEGSVRKATDRLRISAQLIDATTGYHLWSDRFDGDPGDLFALQAKFTTEILLALQVEIQEAELQRIRSKRPEELTAYETVLRASSHFSRFTKADHREARRLLEDALDLDPNYGRAWSLLGVTYTFEFGMGWSFDAALLDRAEELARRSLELDSSLSSSYITLANVMFWRGRIDEAIAMAERALALNPNSAGCYGILGASQAAAGRMVAALGSLRRGIRLDPLAVSPAWVGLAYVNLRAGRTEQGIELLERVRAANADMVLARIALAGYYESVGRHDEAIVVAQEILRVNPDLTVEQALTRAPPGFDRNEFAENPRSAGLP